jgi:hypothetical protein
MLFYGNAVAEKVEISDILPVFSLLLVYRGLGWGLRPCYLIVDEVASDLKF